MKFSSKGDRFLIQLEGIKYKAYKDTAGLWTIGIGHLIKKGEEYLFKKTLTYQECIDLLHKDLADSERDVNNLVKVPLTQFQYDALVIFHYNVGIKNFKNSTVLRLLNARNYSGSVAHFDDWVKIRNRKGVLEFCKGLQNRRDEEQELFIEGDYEKQR